MLLSAALTIVPLTGLNLHNFSCPVSLSYATTAAYKDIKMGHTDVVTNDSLFRM